MKTFTIRESGHKGIEFEYEKKGSNLIFGMPVGQSFIKDCEETGLDNVATLLQRVDIVPDGESWRIVKEQNPRDRRALVAVQTMPGVGGELKLFANTVKETFDEQKKRVVREANDFPPPGVELVAVSKHEALPEEYLIEMQPGASFRITRTGKLQQAAPEIVVLWNGRWDHRVEDPRFRSPDPEKYAAWLEGQYEPRDKFELDTFRHKKDPMKFWGLSVFARSTRHGQV